MEVKLIALTQPINTTEIPTPEALVSYCARVSNPSNQMNHETSEKLLKYCIQNKHWSIFQMVNAVLEIEAPRDITRQFTRHTSIVVTEHEDTFSVKHDGFDTHAGGIQEFSQRYSDEITFVPRVARRQDNTNRQNSIDDLPPEVLKEFNKYVSNNTDHIKRQYKSLRDWGVAKETARVILPEGLVTSRVYANGTLRSWLHFLETRLDESTQLEHRQLAQQVKDVLLPHFPSTLGG